jgi:hypothetical protein
MSDIPVLHRESTLPAPSTLSALERQALSDIVNARRAPSVKSSARFNVDNDKTLSDINKSISAIDSFLKAVDEGGRAFSEIVLKSKSSVLTPLEKISLKLNGGILDALTGSESALTGAWVKLSESANGWNDKLVEKSKFLTSNLSSKVTNSIAPLSVVNSMSKDLLGVDIQEKIAEKANPIVGLFGTGNKFNKALTKRNLLPIDPGSVHVGDKIDELIKDKKGPKDDTKAGILDLFSGGYGGMLASMVSKAGLAAGIIWGVIDGIAAAAKASEWGVSTGAAFIGGFFGGREDATLVERIGAGAGKGALIGMGIGGMVGGPVGIIGGALIGAALFAIGGALGPERVANMAQGVFDWFKNNPAEAAKILGGVVGVAAGFAVGGPVGAVLGGLLGVALGGIAGKFLTSPNMDMKLLMGDIMKDPVIAGAFGAFAGGAIGLAFGPVGLIVGALIGAALGVISGQIGGDALIQKSVTEMISDSVLKSALGKKARGDDLSLEESVALGNFQNYAGKLKGSMAGTVYQSVVGQNLDLESFRELDKILKANPEMAAATADNRSRNNDQADIALAYGYLEKALGGFRNRFPQDSRQFTIGAGFPQLTPGAYNSLPANLKNSIGRERRLSPELFLEIAGRSDLLAEFSRLGIHRDEMTQALNNLFKAKGSTDGGVTRFHTGGIAPHEMNAILRKDEEVLSPFQSRAYRDLNTKAEIQLRNHLAEMEVSLREVQNSTLNALTQAVDKMSNLLNGGSSGTQNNLTQNYVSRFSSKTLMDMLTMEVE